MSSILSLAPGQQLAGYRIDAVAGRGGMGVVYRATQLALDRTVALKLIAPEVAEDSGFRERFQRESRIAASIEHPNVIPVYEAGEADGLLFISMRYVDGTDLRELLARGGPLNPIRAAGIITQVANALDASHVRGLVHRDIKPANVLIASRGSVEHVYLTDFGLSKQSSSQSGLTKTGQWVGTLDYVSPEQIEGKAVGLRTDVYALGCVLFQALTGVVPFERDSEVSKMWAHISEPPPAPSQRRPEVPPALDPVVARAMAKDPEHRFASAGELAAATRAAATGASARGAAASSPPVAAGGGVALPPSAAAPPPSAAAPPPSSATVSGPPAPAGALRPPAPPAWSAAPVRQEPAWGQSPAAPPGFGAPPAAASPTDLASYGQRIGAYLIDGLVIAVLVIALTVAGAAISDAVAALMLFVLGWPLGALIAVVPFMRRRGQGAGQSLGKAATGIRVVGPDGTPASARVLLREVVMKWFVLWSITVWLGAVLDLLWPLWDGERRAMHDIASGTRVVRA
ncbi:MAG: protein kinase domain-containing protein [Solirubrobacteraceae bacterium]